MQIYHDAIRLLQTHPITVAWPQLQAAFERAQTRPPVAWDFPVMACQAVGAPAERAIPTVAAITCAHMAILLIDDLLDEDLRGAHHTMGVGRAANLAVGLNSLGIALLQEGDPLPGPEGAAALNDMIGATAFGQELDVQNVHSEAAYWAVARAKSSPYFAAALALGARAGGAAPAVVADLEQFGEIFGEIMQIHDDLNDCLAQPANADWLQGRAPLPILFAELVEHPQRQRFLELRSQIAAVDKLTAADKLAEAQAILVSSGAISYCVNELLARQKAAEQLLTGMQLADKAPLARLLEQTIAPVQHLFTSVGAEFPDPLRI